MRFFAETSPQLNSARRTKLFEAIGRPASFRDLHVLVGLCSIEKGHSAQTYQLAFISFSTLTPPFFFYEISRCRLPYQVVAFSA